MSCSDYRACAPRRHAVLDALRPLLSARCNAEPHPPRNLSKYFLANSFLLIRPRPTVSPTQQGSTHEPRTRPETRSPFCRVTP
ncbi:hypothetical protein DND47_19340 [Pseudomonas syringae pv. syringae]|nr:hypothetical protein DND47_19340 [Pseudomonas syringae pv. syringae]